MSDSNPWGSLEAKFVTQLKGERIEPVPETIVKMAQRAVDGAPHPTLTNKDGTPKIIHSMQLELPTEELAKAFAAHIHNAGPHTKPRSSIRPVIDPERTKVPVLDEHGEPTYAENGKAIMQDGPPVNPRLVAFQAGQRRGRHTEADEVAE